MLGAAVSGCHNSPSSSSTPPPTAEQPQPSATAGPAPAPAKVVIYITNPKPTGDQDRLMPREIALLHPKEPAWDAINALLRSDQSPLMPSALRGLSVDGGVATLDFSRSPVNETGGESAQSTAMSALAMTLGQFPEIHSYQIEVKGQAVKSFGEFTADGPIDVIRPGAELQAAKESQ